INLIGGKKSALDLSLLQLPVIDGGGSFFRPYQRPIYPKPPLFFPGGDPPPNVTNGRSGPQGACLGDPGEQWKDTFCNFHRGTPEELVFNYGCCVRFRYERGIRKVPFVEQECPIHTRISVLLSGSGHGQKYSETPR